MACRRIDGFLISSQFDRLCMAGRASTLLLGGKMARTMGGLLQLSRRSYGDNWGQFAIHLQ
jgi:hypothetical protein